MAIPTPRPRAIIQRTLGVYIVALAFCTGLLGQDLNSVSPDVRVLMQSAQLAARDGNADEAARLYREVLRIKPRWAPAEFDLALACHFQKNYAEAIGLFTDVIRQDPSITNAYFFRGLDDYETNQYQKAIASLKKALLLQPANPQARFYLGASYDQVGDYREAALTYAKQIELLPNADGAYFQLIQCYEALRDDALKRINSDPQAGYFVLLLQAVNDWDEKDFPQGDAHVQTALRSRTDSPESWLIVALRSI